MYPLMLRCSVLAVGDFPEGGATSQRLYLLTKIINEGLGEASLWILHPSSKARVQENSSVAGEWRGVKFTYLSGSTVRPQRFGGALFDTIREIYGRGCKSQVLLPIDVVSRFALGLVSGNTIGWVNRNTIDLNTEMIIPASFDF